MPVEVHKEPEEPSWWGILENCCMCRARTAYWHASDVALCQQCAKTVNAKDLPTKKEWFDKERKINDGIKK